MEGKAEVFGGEESSSASESNELRGKEKRNVEESGSNLRTWWGPLMETDMGARRENNFVKGKMLMCRDLLFIKRRCEEPERTQK